MKYNNTSFKSEPQLSGRLVIWWQVFHNGYHLLYMEKVMGFENLIINQINPAAADIDVGNVDLCMKT